MTRPLSRAGVELLSTLTEYARLAVCLDVDGTLAPIVQSPQAASVPSGTRSVLRRLYRHDAVMLVLVSGRHPDDARRVAGVAAHWTIGNHGFELARGAEPGRSLVAVMERRKVQRAAAAIARVVDDLEDVVLENKGWTLAVHYRAAGRGTEAIVWRRVRDAVRETGVALFGGKRVINVRPKSSWSKGEAVRVLLRRRYGDAWPRRVGTVYAGDDLTDEHAFAGLPGAAVTIKVGRGKTRARYRTGSPETLTRWLSRLEAALP